jgi:transglutaminase-like putative cysteine protease
VATIDSSVGARSTDYAQALTLAGLLAGASLSLSRLYVGPGWVLPVWLSMACALGLAALLRRFGVGQLLSLLAMVAGFIVVTGVLLFPETLIVVVPTRETFVAMAQAIGDAMRGVSDQAAPVRVTQEFVFLTCAGAWAVTTAADGLAFRARQPLLALVPVLGLFVFPALIRDSSPAWYAFWFLLGGGGLLLFESRARLATWGRWVSSPRARPGVGWRLPLTRANSIGRWMLAAAALVALTLAWLLPGYGQRPLLDYRSGPNASSSIAINPFVSLKTRLNSDINLPVFDVTTAQPTYYRLLVLDRFDGVSFTPSSPTQVVQFGGDTSLDLDGGSPTTQVSQRFTIRQLGGIYLPAAQAPVSAKAGRNAVYQSPTNRDLTLRRPLRTGINYTVTSRVLAPTAADLIGPKSYDSIPGLRPYLDASAVDPKVQSLAFAVASSKPDPYRKALTLQDYLRSSAFKYSLDVPALSSGDNQLRRFLLEVRAGYCEQFAAAMAAMARTLGIPSRVAVGFTPGIPQGDHWEIGSKDSHAWPELYFPGVGWVRFEPTPRGDGQVDVPSYTTAAGRLTTPSSTATTAPGSGGASVTTQSNNAARLAAENDQTGSQLGSPESGRQRVARSGIAFVILVLVLLALIPATKLVRNALARRRARSMPRDAVAEAYDELSDWAGDAGIGRRAAETPSAYASRMSAEFSEDAEPLSELTELYVTAEYAGAEPDGEEAVRARKLARDAHDRLAGRLGWRIRLRATLSPRSLMPPAQPRERVVAGRSPHV